MSTKAPCGICTTTDNVCPVCLEHLCQDMANNAICMYCRTNPAVIASLPKNAAGAVVHPITFRPMTMCGCGLGWNMMCGVASLTSQPGLHRRIQGST